jgi:hypothetical protein
LHNAIVGTVLSNGGRKRLAISSPDRRNQPEADSKEGNARLRNLAHS